MDIMHLVDRLEELFNQSRPIPFTHNVVVDEDRMLDLIDQMRMAIPDEIREAQKILAQRDRVVAQAQEEANRTLTIAREKSEQLLGRDALMQAAQSRADQIIQQARAEAESIRRDADDYVIDTLRRVEMELDRYLTQVRNGVITLESHRRKEPAAPAGEPASGAND